MAKTKQETIFLVSSAGTGYIYAYRRNRKKTKGEKKLSLEKYDPIAKKKCLFTEKSKQSKLAAPQKAAAAPAETTPAA